jgi:hypothetical protein
MQCRKRLVLPLLYGFRNDDVRQRLGSLWGSMRVVRGSMTAYYILGVAIVDCAGLELGSKHHGTSP